MADQCSKKQVLMWFNDLEISLGNQKRSLEKLCNSIRSISSKQKRVVYEANEDDSISPDSLHEVAEKAEIVDFDEIDRLLEKAKSLRIVEDQTESTECIQPDVKKSFIKEAGAQKIKKVPQIASKAPKPTASSRHEGARQKSVGTLTQSQRSKLQSSSKSLLATRKRQQSSQAIADVKGVKSCAAAKSFGASQEPEKQLHQSMKQMCTPVRDIQTGATRNEFIARQDLRETVSIKKELIDNCMKIRNLREKIFDSVKNPSTETLQAKVEFLETVENSFSEDFDFPYQLLDPEPEEIQSFRKAVNRKLADVSPLSKLLSSIKVQGTYACSTQELQALCKNVLKLQERTIELKGKEILFEWSSKLLHSGHLTTSERINTYRKLYGLLLSSGKHLPAMIKDSEATEYDDGDVGT